MTPFRGVMGLLGRGRILLASFRSSSYLIVFLGLADGEVWPTPDHSIDLPGSKTGDRRIEGVFITVW